MENSIFSGHDGSGVDSDGSSSSSSSTCTVGNKRERSLNQRAMRWLIVEESRNAIRHPSCIAREHGSSSRSSSSSSGGSRGSRTSSVSDRFELDDFCLQASVAARTLHIAVRQRSSKKLWTAIWGFPEQVLGHRLDLPKMLRAMKKMFRTNGSLRTESRSGVIIQLNGDCWKAARHFLVNQSLAEEDSIECHGVLGLGLGGLRDLAQLDAILLEEEKPQALDRASSSRSTAHQAPLPVSSFQTQRLCLIGFQGLSQAAVSQDRLNIASLSKESDASTNHMVNFRQQFDDRVQDLLQQRVNENKIVDSVKPSLNVCELVQLEKQLRSRLHSNRGGVGSDVVHQTEAALEHLEVVDADAESGEVALLVHEQAAYNTILRLFEKGSLKFRGRTVALRKEGDIFNAMDWHQIRYILGQIEKTRGHRSAETRQLTQRLEDLLEVVDANTRALFGPGHLLSVLSLLIRFELDHCAAVFALAKWEPWKRVFALVQRALKTLSQTPDAVMDDSTDLCSDTNSSAIERQEQTLNFLHYSILQLSDEFQKILQTEDREVVHLQLADFYELLRLMDNSCCFFQKNADHCPEAHWRIAARILDGVYNMDSAYFDLNGIGEEIGMPTLHSWIQRLGSIVRSHGDAMAQTTAALQQVYHAALCNQFQEASTLLVLSEAPDRARVMEQHIQILCNQTVAQLGLCAFRLGKLSEAKECLQNICAKGRAKELLGHRPISDEKAFTQTSRLRPYQLPCHRIVSVEIVEVVYLITEMLWQVPTLGSIEVGSKLAPKSLFHRKLCQFEAATYSGPPQDRFECVLVASRRLQQGDWESCMTLLERALVAAWQSSETTQVIDMLRKHVQKSALKTHLIDSCAMYESFEVSRLANMFCLDERFVHSTVSRMMIEKELPAAWDESSRLILVHDKAQAPIWDMAYQLASSIVERNEKCIKNVTRSGSLGKSKQTSSQRQVGQKIASLLRSEGLEDSKRKVASQTASVDKTKATKDDPREGQSSGDCGKGRQSRFRKDLINLNKAVVRWMKKVAANQMAYDDVLLCIGRSPAMQHLQEVHGASFCEQAFVNELMARATKTMKD